MHARRGERSRSNTATYPRMDTLHRSFTLAGFAVIDNQGICCGYQTSNRNSVVHGKCMCLVGHMAFSALTNKYPVESSSQGIQYLTSETM